MLTRVYVISIPACRGRQKVYTVGGNQFLFCFLFCFVLFLYISMLQHGNMCDLFENV